MGLSVLAVAWTSRILVACAGAILIRLIIGPRGTDRLIALSAISSIVLALLVLYGASEGKAAYLDVALVYDIFGFLGILAIAEFIKERP